MGFIHCCSGRHRSKSYRLVPEENYLVCEMDYLEECPICGHSVLQLTRIDLDHNVSITRKINVKARKLYNRLKPSIICEKRKIVKTQGGFYLNYNEFGVKKKCYSNLSTMKMGLFDNSSTLKIITPFLY